MKNIKIMLLVGGGEAPLIVYNALKDHFDILAVIKEKKIPSIQLIKKRIKRLGLMTVFGQLLFLLYLKVLKNFSRLRMQQIKKNYNLSSNLSPKDIILQTDTINDDFVAEKIIELRPDVIIVKGTRIIHDKILSTQIPFINIHAGITPRYRGVHGGYWALAENKPSLAGVTIHLVDSGIDTGSILNQGPIFPTPKDNFLTYPLLQLGAAIPLLRKAIIDIYHAQHEIIKNDLTSKLYSHPTIFQYMRNYWLRGVK